MKSFGLRRINGLLVLMIAVSAIAHGAVLLTTMTLHDDDNLQSDKPAPIRLVTFHAEQQKKIEKTPTEEIQKLSPEQPDLVLPDAVESKGGAEKRETETTRLKPPSPPPQKAEKVSSKEVDSADSSVAAATPEQPLKQEQAETNQQSTAPKPVAEAIESNAVANEGTAEGAEGSASSMESYFLAIQKRIEEHKYYPSQARDRRYQGKTTIAFKLREDGQIESPKVCRSSGRKILDRAALQSVTDATPFPPRPKDALRGTIALEITLSYKM